MSVFERPEVVERYGRERAQWRDLYPSESWILSHLPTLSVHTVLDFGCAAGGFRNLFPHAQYSGVDQSLSMLEKAKESHPDSLFWDNLPDSGLYDLVMSLGTLPHIADWESRIWQLWKLTRTHLVIDLRLGSEDRTGTYQDVPYHILSYRRALRFLNCLNPQSLTLHGYTHASNCEEFPEVFMGVFLLEKRRSN